MHHSPRRMFCSPPRMHHSPKNPLSGCSWGMEHLFWGTVHHKDVPFPESDNPIYHSTSQGCTVPKPIIRFPKTCYQVFGGMFHSPIWMFYSPHRINLITQGCTVPQDGCSIPRSLVGVHRGIRTAKEPPLKWAVSSAQSQRVPFDCPEFGRGPSWHTHSQGASVKLGREFSPKASGFPFTARCSVAVHLSI